MAARNKRRARCLISSFQLPMFLLQASHPWGKPALACVRAWHGRKCAASPHTNGPAADGPEWQQGTKEGRDAYIYIYNIIMSIYIRENPSDSFYLLASCVYMVATLVDKMDRFTFRAYECVFFFCVCMQQTRVSQNKKVHH